MIHFRASLYSYKECLTAVKKDGFNIKYCPDRYLTEELYLEAVKQNGYCICFIPLKKTNQRDGKSFFKRRYN
jgi:hypothetical protein